MSEAAELWLASQDRPYGQGPGMPHWCVKYVPCSHCGAKAGELCVGKQGPWINHHFMRARDYTTARRAGKVPPPPRDERDGEVLRLAELAQQQAEGNKPRLAIQTLAKALEVLVRGGGA